MVSWCCSARAGAMKSVEDTTVTHAWERNGFNPGGQLLLEMSFLPVAASACTDVLRGLQQLGNWAAGTRSTRRWGEYSCQQGVGTAPPGSPGVGSSHALILPPAPAIGLASTADRSYKLGQCSIMLVSARPAWSPGCRSVRPGGPARWSRSRRKQGSTAGGTCWLSTAAAAPCAGDLASHGR